MSGPIKLSQVILEEYEHLYANDIPSRITNEPLPYQCLEHPELLIARLRNADETTDPAAFHFRSALHPHVRGMLASFCGSQTQLNDISKALLADINDLLQDPSFDMAAFTNDSRLSNLTKKFITQSNDQLANSPFLKRLVLGDLFSDHLEKLPLSEVHKLIHQRPQGTIALCLSGGGIRSAVFALGLIQALTRLKLTLPSSIGHEKHKLLEPFDYLSTVSGGGYIGSWLSAWIYREAQTSGGCTPALNKIMNALTEKTGNALESDAGPITFLRRYRNYLSPNWSVFSVDTWTLLATYLRNLFLNWLVIIPALLGLLALPRIGVYLVELICWPQPLSEAFLVAGTVLTVLSIAVITVQLVRTRSPLSRTEANKDCQTDFRRYCLYPLTLAAVCLTFYWAHLPQPKQTRMMDFILFATFVHISGVCLGIIYRLLRNMGRSASLDAPITQISSRLQNSFWVGLALAISSTASGLAAGAVAMELFGDPKSNPHAYVTLAAPLLLLIFLLAGDLLVGFLSKWKTDEHREWKARLNAFVLMTCFAWSAGSTLVLYGPQWFAEFPYPAILSSLGGISGLLALFLGFSPKTKAMPEGEEKESTADTARRWALSASAPLGVVFVIVFLSWWTSAMFLKWPMASTFEHAMDQISTHQDWPYYRLVAHSHQHIVQRTSGSTLLIFMGACLIGSIVMSWFIDINKFSLHALYRDRLIRTFLGASRERNPDCFTGFDPDDNVQMCEFSKTRCGPFHVINVAVNLLSTNNLAWRSRKAASFTITPLHAGSAVSQLGYRRSKDYGRRNDSRSQSITIGTALAISGAAASPNMGYHSSPAVTFLLSLFNIRLGWWLGNPGKAGNRTGAWVEEGKLADNVWKRAYPRFALFWWIKESLGHTREDNAYVYLSDGGHFENLGLYEMVLRRCRFIVVSDAGCDPTYSFEDLGNAIRKIRVDVGIDIEIDLGMLRSQTGQRYSRWHHAIGTIRYDKVDPNAPVGILVYIKTSLTGDEPADVLEYAGAHTDFPHQSTGDQFFDEAQFESYRALGEHIASEVFRPASNLKVRLHLDRHPDCNDVFHALKSHWVTLPPGIQDSFLKQTEAFVRLERMLRDDPDLARYDREIYPELEMILGSRPASSLSNDSPRAQLHLTMQIIQLMEDVFLALSFEKYHAHSLNRGWMNLFRRWTATDTLRLLWPSLRSSFGKAFVEFAEYQLNLKPPVAPPMVSNDSLSVTASDRLVAEFEQEWPNEDIRQEFSQMLYAQTSIIFKATPQLGATPQDQVWGIAMANRSSESAPFKIIVWVRGGYRGVGIGKELLRMLMEYLRSPSRNPSPGAEAIVELPKLREDFAGYSLEKDGWMRFYAREGFVRQSDDRSRYILKTRLIPPS